MFRYTGDALGASGGILFITEVANVPPRDYLNVIGNVVQKNCL